MSAKLIVTFKDSLMGVPSGLNYKVLANDKEIDKAIIPNTEDVAITYDFKSNESNVVVLSSNGNQTTIPKADVYNIILKIIDTKDNTEKIIGSGLLANGKKLTIVAISPWTKIPLDDGSQDIIPTDTSNLDRLGNFFEIEYNERNTNNQSKTIRIVIRDLPRKIILTALKYRHSSKWSGDEVVTSTHPVLNQSVTFKSGTNKCNVFVNDILTEAGISVPWIEHGRARYIPWYVDGLSPPTAGEWANSSLLKKNWSAVTTPLPGDIGAYSADYADASGHVGIIVTSGVTISAGWYFIEVNDAGFRNKNGTAGSSDHDFSIFRRYKGTL